MLIIGNHNDENGENCSPKNTSPTASSIPRHLFPNNKFDSIQTTAIQPLKEAALAGLVLFHALRCTQNFTVSALIDRHRHQNSHILKLSVLISAQIDPIYVDVRIAPPCSGRLRQSSMWTYAFLFSSLMVAGDTLLPHRASVISSTRRTDTPAKYISMRGFLHTALPAAMPLNDGSFK